MGGMCCAVKIMVGIMELDLLLHDDWAFFDMITARCHSNRLRKSLCGGVSGWKLYPNSRDDVALKQDTIFAHRMYGICIGVYI